MGNIGIGTNSPTAKLEVKGHIGASSTSTPTLTACGTTPTITGNDVRGTVVTGTTNASTCTINFSSSFASTPVCVVADIAANNGAYITSVSTSALVISNGQNKTFSYICLQ